MAILARALRAGSSRSTHSKVAAGLLAGLLAAPLISTGAAASPVVAREEATEAADAGEPSTNLLSIGDVTVVEGNAGQQVAVLGVTLSTPAVEPVTVQYSVTGGTAELGTDWLPGPTTELTIRAGKASAALKIKVLGDTEPEEDEDVVVTLTHVAGATVVDGVGTVTILDDDTHPTTGASIGDAVLHEGDAQKRSAKLLLTLSDPAETDIQLTISRTGGTATAGIDDKARASRAVTIRAGRHSKAISVPILPDRLAEATEVVRLQLSSDDIAVARDIGTVTIVDDSTDVGPVVDTPPPGDQFYEPPPVGTGTPGELIWSRPQWADNDGRQDLMLYRSRGQTGRHVFVTGTATVPATPPPAGGYDVVVWAHPTVGMGDHCAPSKGVVDLPAAGLDLVRAGYVVVTTDYEGLGTPGPHPFLQSASEAAALLDAVRATRDLGVPVSDRTAVFGGSRGGHAAVAFAERAPAYAPEAEVVGALGLGAAVIDHTDALVDYAMSSPFKGLFMMAARGVQQVHGPSSSGVKSFLEHYLTPNGVARLPEADGCIIEVIGSFFSSPSGDLFHLTRPSPTPAVEALRRTLEVGDIGTDVPILLMSGNFDPLVPPHVINSWHAGACTKSPTIELRWYDAGHFPEPNAEITSWIDARFEGAPAATTCPS
jgi:pimeloyl-ACP methyl ester carboxylesterase